MTPESIKNEVQDAYLKAMENRSTHWLRQSQIQHLFQDVKLFGREAGIDFIETKLEEIVREAVEAARCKEASLLLTPHGFGRAALEGMMHALRELTALRVEARGSGVCLTWADTAPRVI